MKILFVSNAKSVHTVRWVNELNQKGHEVHLAYCKNDKHVQNNIDQRVVLHPLPFSRPFGYYLNAARLRKLYQKLKPDVVNVHYASGYGTLARKSKIPYVLSVWGSDVYDYPYKSKSNFKRVVHNLNHAKAIASTSYAMAEQTRKILNDNHKEITITPFGVDISRFRPIDITDAEDDKIIIGTVKTLSIKYGIEYAIRAFHKLLNMNKDNGLYNKLVYEIYGQGEQKEELENLIAELDLKDKCYLRGYIENNDLPKIINRFTVSLFSSILDSESFGVVAVESMACGVPCVASDADGFKEVIQDGKTGYIAKRKDVCDIADKLNAILHMSKDAYKAMKNNCIERVKSRYVFSDNVDAMLELYSNFNSL